MKKYIKNIIYFIIEKIENKQFKNITLDQADHLKKITNITFLKDNELYVDSPEGWVGVTEINETQPYKIWEIKTDKGKKLSCADNHIVFDSLGQEIFINELSIGQHIMTSNGFEKVISIERYKYSNCMVDLTINSNESRYFTNGIVSHNTICAAISILHYALFNKDKGIMIVANKGETVIEILDKIKNIYKLLPFYLQAGIINWNQKSIVFDNKCRIKSQARSKEPAIGFTIDYLYMDEFAHIPPNIINHYYKAAVPTVSSINGSKIVITSTPNGANLFKDLVMGASLPDNHPDKNMYKLIKVYWHQVPDGKYEDNTVGTRLDPRVFPMPFEMKNNNYTLEKLMAEFRSVGFKCVKDYQVTENGDKEFIRILHQPEKSDLNIVKRFITSDGVNISKFTMVTNWKEDEVKLIGGEESFNQEYNLQFIAGSKRVLSAMKAKILEERSVKYLHQEFNILNERLKFNYDELKWHPDFIFNDIKDRYFITSIDTSEGLGQDESVINGFELCVRDQEWLEKNKIKSMFDAFYLKQAFIYNFSRLDPKKELPELFYLIHFEILNPNKTKCVLELNGPGHVVLASMPGVFGGSSNYGNYIFVRYLHNMNDKIKKPGLKVTRNKRELVKNYIDSIEEDLTYVDEEETLNQMDNFIKIPTPSGGITYKADSGFDDITMTIVNMSSIFNMEDFKNMCYAKYMELSTNIQTLIDNALDLKYNPDAISYKSVKSALNNNTSKRSTRYSGGKGRFIR